MLTGGEGEIRTHGTREGTTVFETVPIDHSGTSPREARYSIRNTKGKLAGRVPEERGGPVKNAAVGLVGRAPGASIAAFARPRSQPIARNAPLRPLKAAPDVISIFGGAADRKGVPSRWAPSAQKTSETWPGIAVVERVERNDRRANVAPLNWPAARLECRGLRAPAEEGWTPSDR